MKKLTSLLLLFFTFLSTQAQILDPVKWKTSVEKKSDNEVVLVFEAAIDNEWHMYSQFTPEGGALPTVFTYKDSKGNYEIVGKTKESEYKKVFNDVFEVDEYYFANKARFTQTIKVTNPNLKSVKAAISYQVCKEACIQQDKTFEFVLPALKIAAYEATAGSVSDTLQTAATVDTAAVKETVAAVDTAKPIGKKEEQKGLFTIFIIAFFSGFAALLTPCVFPMIPMTVSFFTKQSKTKAQGIKNAVIYGISIILIYVLLGSLVTAIFGADALNALSTNVWFNIIFFILLVVFASSFLGAFEIMLPNSWANKVDRQADRGGIIGILFMALALAIVSFSCTGPIVGTLLVEAASKGGIAPIVGMLGFSLALALPFMLFAMFPGWLNSLPKSGGWLNTVKVVLGFLELALAFKFLSNADLVLQLHLLEREVFLAIWIAIFGVLALYLFGKITLPHDSPLSHISVGRLYMGLLVLMFTVYLIPGLWGAPLKLISGFPPPMTYSESPYGVGNAKGGSSTASEKLPDGAKLGAHDIMAFTDYEKGMAYAKSVNKPVLLDFTGFACVNCRKMEDFVWSKPEILAVLKEKVVLISLYVDDKRELPKNEQYVSKETGKEIVTVGNKWSDFQITHYKANAQPYYIILDNQENRLSEPVGYTPDAEEYKLWLDTAIAKYK
ncbi:MULTISPECIES: thioredoxin family protein [unclassified Flavobacterium]|uniref:protein-disulfide reductase DsbD family protein n=1 Tax=unclassified Flavobacterium TaxID=196869 RepID=UPI00095A52CB|nr:MULTISPECIES: thioredoxin family protein [unclassified Flavobacterium]MBN9284901.1 thioredoxin family protein [Flavobacterium sp.]OJV72214.1 MAG: thiol:disulfide interchange protein [Flavobacterium sp. 40-81]